jgi:hypothetical protein
VNRNEKTERNEMFMQVVGLAMKVSEETDGAFDSTVAPLVNAWGFGFKSGTQPTPQAIDSLKALVGYKKITLDTRRKTISKKDSTRASYYNYYTGKKWGAAESYDLCINTSIFGLDETAKFIADFIRKR